MKQKITVFVILALGKRLLWLDFFALALAFFGGLIWRLLEKKYLLELEEFNFNKNFYYWPNFRLEIISKTFLGVEITS